MEAKVLYNTLKSYKTQLESLGYTVLFIGIYGSQNYNLDDKNSDIDAKAVVLPTFEQLVRHQPVSTIVNFDSGQVDVKDLITFDQQIRKGNVVGLETVGTKYYLGDKRLKEYGMKFPLNLRSVLGMMYQKLEALDHPYPSKLKEIEKGGFDPKQYHHIIRLSQLIQDHLNNILPENAPFIPYGGELKKELIEIKRNADNWPVDIVKPICNTICNKADELLRDVKFTPAKDDEFIINYLKTKMRMKLYENEAHYVREYRTFDNSIPKSDLAKFPALEKYKDDDISYLVGEELEIL